MQAIGCILNFHFQIFRLIYANFDTEKYFVFGDLKFQYIKNIHIMYPLFYFDITDLVFMFPYLMTKQIVNRH